jgi:hypothetical protein
MKRPILRIMMVIAIVLISASAITTGQAAPGEALASGATASLSAAPSTRTLAQGTDLKRIRFASGATSALVSGDLPARSSARYVLRALAGQLMELNLSAPQGASLSVTTAAGRALTPVAGSSTTFRGYLPRSGDYLIEVESGRRAVSYSLSVSIPQRVAFESGATSITLEGHVGAHQSHDYILDALAGQLMEIDVAPENSLQLIIYGVDGTVLRSGMGEGSSFRGELPLSGDYIVRVRAGDQDVSFSMNVVIPRRITFERGAVSASLRGAVSASHSQYYVLRALKDQIMQVNVTSGRAVQLIIYGADSTVLKSGMGEGSSFSGDLPATQDYVLVVRADSGAAAYSLRVTIR